MDIVDVAKICHQANKAYCESLGDYSQHHWDAAPEWQKESAAAGVVYHLEILVKGGDPPPNASHENWRADKLKDGWKYGPVKDPDKKEHPCMVPFEELSPSQRAKDYLFGGIVRALFEAGVVTLPKATAAP